MKFESKKLFQSQEEQYDGLPGTHLLRRQRPKGHGSCDEPIWCQVGIHLSGHQQVAPSRRSNQPSPVGSGDLASAAPLVSQLPKRAVSGGAAAHDEFHPRIQLDVSVLALRV